MRINEGRIPFKMRNKEVHLLDLTALVAGTQFRGQFESRMKGLIDEVKKDRQHHSRHRRGAQYCRCW